VWTLCHHSFVEFCGGVFSLSESIQCIKIMLFSAWYTIFFGFFPWLLPFILLSSFCHHSPNTSYVTIVLILVNQSVIRSDEGLTLETSAFQSLYGGQFTLSTPLMNQIFLYHSPTDAAPQFLHKLIPFNQSVSLVSKQLLHLAVTFRLLIDLMLEGTFPHPEFVIIVVHKSPFPFSSNHICWVHLMAGCI